MLDLEDDDGIIGVIVSDSFRGMASVDRQFAIDKALRSPPAPLSADEIRRVFAIAPMTPEEYVAYALPGQSKRKGPRPV